MERRVKVWVQELRGHTNLYLQWHDPTTGKRKSKSAGTPDRRAAEVLARDLESDLNHGRYADAPRLTWEHFRTLFEAEYVAALRPNTRLGYTSALDTFERICSPGRLASITERTLSAFIAGMRSLPIRGGRVGLIPSSMRVYLRCLRSALGWALEQKLLTAIPTFPSIKVPSKTPQSVASESVERLLAGTADVQMRAYILCGWLAGLRRNEAGELEWEETREAPWVDFGRDRIVFPAEYVKAVADQWVPLDAELRAALEGLPRVGRRVFRFFGRSGNVLNAVSIGKRLARLASRCGLRLTMKSLRRGFGCYYAARVPAQVLQKLMRHADIKTTLTYYVNVDLAVEDAVRRRNPQRNPDTMRPAECRR